MEVNICHNGDRRASDNRTDRLGSFLVVHRHTDNIASSFSSLTDLPQCPLDVVRLCLCHRLDRDRGISPNQDSADVHTAGLPPHADLVGWMLDFGGIVEEWEFDVQSSG